MTNIIILFLIFILFCSIVSSFAVSKIVVLKNSKTTNKMINFVEKSTGLNNPEKDGGSTELELADINNDGHLDIICVGDHGSPYVNSGQHGIMVWLGDGLSTWSVNQVGDFGYGGCEAGDLNLDGYLDVVWGIHHNYGDPGFGDTLIGAALGNGDGSNWSGWAEGFDTGGETYGMFATDLADFNCNGLLDIISQSFGCCNGYHLYENNGDGTWTHRWSLTDGNVQANLEVGDFNADGYPDFVGTRAETYVFIGDGNFHFTLNQDGLPGGNYNGIDCGDMNNDGCDDLVFGPGSAGIKCYNFDKQNNKWISASNGLPNSGTYYPQFGDINGDGFLDIITYNEPIGNVYLGDGNGNWESDATFEMPPVGYYSAFVVDGDFDHDGREDVVIQAEQGSWPSYQNVLKAFSPWLEPSEISILVQIPHGGETFRSGSIRNIRWLSGVPQSQGNSEVEIQLSLNGDLGPWRTIAKNLPNNGCYQWLVDACGSKHCRIKVIASTSSSNASAISTLDFIALGFNVDAHGPYKGFVDDPVQFTGSAENGSPPFQYYWDFGDGFSSNEQNPSYAYNTEGNFTVTLSVTDSNKVTIRDSTWVLIGGDNNPPSVPIIKGPTSGKTGISYDYTFNSSDTEGDELKYHINWGDGTDEVIEDFPPNTEAPASHAWIKKGSYSIEAKAEDQWGALSDLGSLTVGIPRERQLVKSNFFKLLKEISIINQLSERLNIIFRINILLQGLKI